MQDKLKEYCKEEDKDYEIEKERAINVLKQEYNKHKITDSSSSSDTTTLTQKNTKTPLI